MDEGMSGFGLKPSSRTGSGGAKCGRWNPTNEQVKVLTDLFRSGLCTPSTDQIQKISSHLSFYGKIESKNVFYWFQNHKARERQKRRRVYVESDQNDHNIAKQHFAEVVDSGRVIETLQLFPVHSLAFTDHSEKTRGYTNDECKENTSPYATMYTCGTEMEHHYQHRHPSLDLRLSFMKAVLHQITTLEISETVSSIPKISPPAFDKLMNDSLQDQLLLLYLSSITRTQLSLAEKLNTAAQIL